MVVQEKNKSRVTVNKPALTIAFLTERDVLISLNRSRKYKPTHTRYTGLKQVGPIWFTSMSLVINGFFAKSLRYAQKIILGISTICQRLFFACPATSSGSST